MSTVAEGFRVGKIGHKKRIIKPGKSGLIPMPKSRLEKLQILSNNLNRVVYKYTDSVTLDCISYGYVKG